MKSLFVASTLFFGIIINASVSIDIDISSQRLLLKEDGDLIRIILFTLSYKMFSDLNVVLFNISKTSTLPVALKNDCFFIWDKVRICFLYHCIYIKTTRDIIYVSNNPSFFSFKNKII